MEELERVLHGLARDLDHRGPDDRGFFVSRGGRAGLVNTRLAILDLSPAGHQPMQSADGRYTIVFNGEIYNYEALREALLAEGCRLESHSDTEVILEMYARQGRDCVRELAGMFAFAIWDEAEGSCFVARDPLGIKPLYYCDRDGRFSFASEVRALLQAGLVERRLCSEGVSGYLLFGSVPEPLTLVDGVCALPAGHHLLWQGGKVQLTKYWDVSFGNTDGGLPAAAGELDAEGEEPVAIVRRALAESVRRHLVSDVPVGVFLSGGIDSTAIAGLAAKEMGSDLRTFCISFDDPGLNEGEVAARTAKHLGAVHTDWRLDSATAGGLLAEFLKRSDQPSIDGFNTFCVAKLAHEHGLKVVLSGLGGDEIFGGYKSFQTLPKLVRARRGMMPLWPLRPILGRALSTSLFSARVNRLGQLLTEPPLTSAAYWTMRGIFTPGEVKRLLPGYGCTFSKAADKGLAFHVPAQPTLEDEVSYLELTRYMRNQLLRDGDVMSMAWSLELRVPFVDSRLIESVQKIPAAIRLAKGKQILLDAVPEIPHWVRERPKQGFTFPFQDWVAKEWRDVFEGMERKAPVRLGSWYRTWCLFALESFIERNGLS